MWIYLLHIYVNIKFCVCHRITSTPMKMTFLRRVVKSWYESHCLYPSICVVGTLYPVHHTLRSHLSVIRHSCVCTRYETSREMRTRNIAPPSWHCHLIWSRCSLSLSLSLFLSSSLDFFVTCVDISSPFRWHMQSRHIYSINMSCHSHPGKDPHRWRWHSFEECRRVGTSRIEFLSIPLSLSSLTLFTNTIIRAAEDVILQRLKKLTTTASERKR
jgi:hypothetical protein